MASFKYLQHIYTSSFVKRGYHTIRYTSNISDTDLVELEKRGLYKPPKGGELPVRPQGEELELLPKQFASYYLSSGKRVFCRSVYRGRDNHSRSSRFGNYFSHSIIIEDDGEFILPFDLWKKKTVDVTNDKNVNEIWQDELNRDKDTFGSQWIEGNIPLSYLELKCEPTDYFAELEFLKEGNRLNHFAEIIDTLLRNNKQRFIIIDKAGNLPLWVCSIALVFPPHLSSQITFSSYYYNPINTDYQIVGIMKENELSSIELEDTGFKVINAEISTDYAAGEEYSKEIYDAILSDDVERFGGVLQQVEEEKIREISIRLNIPIKILKVKKQIKNSPTFGV